MNLSVVRLCRVRCVPCRGKGGSRGGRNCVSKLVWGKWLNTGQRRTSDKHPRQKLLIASDLIGLFFLESVVGFCPKEILLQQCSLQYLLLGHLSLPGVFLSPYR